MSAWSRRTVCAAVALLATPALLLGAPLAATAASATDASRALAAGQVVDAPGTISFAGVDSIPDDSVPVFVTVDVPDGLSPTAATATLTPVESDPTGTSGTVRVTVKGELRQSVDAAQAAALDIPLSASDVVDGRLAIGLTYIPAGALSDAAAVAACTPPATASVSLSAGTVAVTGDATAPTTVADFFSPALNAISVTLPDDPSGAVRAAGLAAIGSLAKTFPSPVALSLTTASDATSAVSVEPTRGRIVTFASTGDTSADSSQPVETALSTSAAGVPQLTITGPESELAAAGAALGSAYLPLAFAGTTSGLSQSGSSTAGSLVAGLEHTFTDLGAGNQIALSVPAETASVVNVSQSAFGGPIGDATVHVVGTHSAIPDSVVATMNVYWNDFLIGSAVLGNTPAFDVSLPVASTRLTAANALKVTLSAQRASGECLPPETSIPIELFVDNRASTVSGTRGQSLDAGFQRFPQALGQTLPVAFGTGLDAASALSAAGDIVASLQRNSTVQLGVSVMSVGDFASSTLSGLVVGATSEDSNTLKAPLRLDSFKAIDSKTLTFGVGTSTPYAALEGFETNGRNILMLGGWAPDGSASDATASLQRRAADHALTGTGAWFGLSGDVIVAGPGADEPVALSSNAIVPQTAVTSDYNSYALWGGIVLAILILAGVIGEIGRRRRRRKLAKYVDAQLAADSDRVSAQQGEADPSGRTKPLD
ncbi:hypothetical protein B7R22_15920 [Subtercola boreus]|uniref:Cellulose synthase n=1 Tax=Subtercola boreus TaxID=120213 RepID=A0A3E0VQM7_9MICO|nr:hypothetical protein [Subtercola boreus]RFA12294.1 hypothetical protein B7R22_15920 [Subtercola boreus]